MVLALERTRGFALLQITYLVFFEQATGCNFNKWRKEREKTNKKTQVETCWIYKTCQKTKIVIETLLRGYVWSWQYLNHYLKNLRQKINFVKGGGRWVWECKASYLVSIAWFH